MCTRLLSGILSLALYAVTIAGCGGDSGGGTAMLATSYISASVGSSSIDSDVVAWVDATGAKTTACTGFTSTPAPNSVDVTVLSSAYASTGSSSLPVRIASSTVTFTPTSVASPAIQPLPQTIGTVLTTPGSVTIPVRIVTTEQKRAFMPALACSNIVYNYYVTITLQLEEIGTSKTGTVSTSLQLRLSDYIDA
jgi:hypothetical protein